MTQKHLYPPCSPYNQGTLEVPSTIGHQVYYEEVGNPDGKPVIFLHGGPGGGLESKYRQFFNPDIYRIVLMDQRGAGQSTPYAELRENTTWDLVNDVELLKNHLNIDHWQVFGGSWGSTLALAYAITHPASVTELVLRGLFLCRPKEIRWFYQDGASHIFPEAWESYQSVIPESERHDFVKAYYKRLTSPNLDVQTQAAQAWSTWEAATSKLVPSEDMINSFNDPKFAIPFARIECHYFNNNAFFSTDNFLIENIEKIQHIPCHVVHGRYDMVCPIENAWELKNAWPEAKLHIIPNAGHSAFELGITQKLLEITDLLAEPKKEV